MITDKDRRLPEYANNKHSKWSKSSFICGMNACIAYVTYILCIVVFFHLLNSSTLFQYLSDIKMAMNICETNEIAQTILIRYTCIKQECMYLWSGIAVKLGLNAFYVQSPCYLVHTAKIFIELSGAIAGIKSVLWRGAKALGDFQFQYPTCHIYLPMKIIWVHTKPLFIELRRRKLYFSWRSRRGYFITKLNDINVYSTFDFVFEQTTYDHQSSHHPGWIILNTMVHIFWRLIRLLLPTEYGYSMNVEQNHHIS